MISIFSVIQGIPGTQAWVEYHADTETVYIKFEGESQNGDSGSNGVAIKRLCYRRIKNTNLLLI